MEWMHLTGKLHYHEYLAKILQNEFGALEHDAGHVHICIHFHIEDPNITLQTNMHYSTSAKLNFFWYQFMFGITDFLDILSQ
jgi:hypothetical protein